MTKVKFLFHTLIISFLISCSSYEKYKKNIDSYSDPSLFHESMQKLTDVIVYDIFSPPVASRIYAYPTIAAYEVLINENPNYKSLSGKLNGLESVPLPDPGLEYSFPVASIHAFLEVGRDLIFSGNLENNKSFFLFFEKSISNIPISGFLDFTTFPPVTSPNN